MESWPSGLPNLCLHGPQNTGKLWHTERPSHCQLCWQEFLPQYKVNMVYIPSPENTVTDALSRLPKDSADVSPLHESWWSPVAAILSISTDQTVLDAIKCGHAVDEYCLKVSNSNMPGTKCVNEPWYIGDHLLMPHIGDIHENLFRLAHDTLSHFGANKSYATLCDTYFWPNMWCDLEKVYIPSCQDCQRNKSHTTKAPRPLHPLPVLDDHGTSVAIDFVGPLKLDQGFNCILMITDQLGANIHIIPTHIDINAKDLAVLLWILGFPSSLNYICISYVLQLLLVT